MFADDVHLDFAAILLILAAVTGAIYLLDVLLWARSRGPGTKPSGPIEISRSFFPVILIVLVLRSFIAEPFRIPSGSMIPTLHIGDFILVNKFSYGLRLPVFHTEVIPLGLPERGDVVVFRYPEDPSKDFIKRIVGLPGDVIEYRGKVLSVNGEAVEIEPVGLYQSADPRHRYATEYQAFWSTPERRPRTFATPFPTGTISRWVTIAMGQMTAAVGAPCRSVTWSARRC